LKQHAHCEIICVVDLPEVQRASLEAVNLFDFAIREPLAVDDTDAFNLGAHRLRFLVTPSRPPGRFFAPMCSFPR
jgi:hypothetical protein